MESDPSSQNPNVGGNPDRGRAIEPGLKTVILSARILHVGT